MHYHALSHYPESDVVLVNQAGQEKVIVVKPNHSATWRHNLWLLVALAVPSLGAGIAFALLGAFGLLGCPPRSAPAGPREAPGGP